MMSNTLQDLNIFWQGGGGGGGVGGSEGGGHDP